MCLRVFFALFFYCTNMSSITKVGFYGGKDKAHFLFPDSRCDLLVMCNNGTATSCYTPWVAKSAGN